MQIFLLGKTKVGKTTLSNHLLEILNEKNIAIYEAGSWAREQYKTYTDNKDQDEMSNEFKNSLTQFSLDTLKINPYHSFNMFMNWKEKNKEKNKLIIGVRNPDDFLLMLKEDSQNKVILIKTNKVYLGQLELFEEGLNIIESYIDWKEKLYPNNPLLSILKIDEEQINDKQLLITLKDFL